MHIQLILGASIRLSKQIELSNTNNETDVAANHVDNQKQQDSLLKTADTKEGSAKAVAKAVRSVSQVNTGLLPVRKPPKLSQTLKQRNQKLKKKSLTDLADD